MEVATKTLNYNAISEGISEWLKDYATKAGAKGFVLGVSGGIDSAVVSALCAKTGLPLLILEMPIHQGTAEVDRAKNHITWLKENYPNVTSKVVDLTDVYDGLYNTIAMEVSGDGSGIFTKDTPVSEEDYDFSMANSRSRLRMLTLYQYSGMLGLLVAGTGNKVEDFGIGFYTKYGDGGVDISPIADLMKSEVYALGAELGVHSDILTAAPTDGLHDDARTDEMQIGATYDELEYAMDFRANGRDTDEDGLTERQIEVIRIYDKFHNSNKHKMESIPVFETSKFRK